MNRRDFLQRLGLAAGAVALSPLLDLAPILPAPSVCLAEDEFVAWVTWTARLYVQQPAWCCRITNIS